MTTMKVFSHSSNKRALNAGNQAKNACFQLEWRHDIPNFLCSPRKQHENVSDREMSQTSARNHSFMLRSCFPPPFVSPWVGNAICDWNFPPQQNNSAAEQVSFESNQRVSWRWLLEKKLKGGEVSSLMVFLVFGSFLMWTNLEWRQKIKFWSEKVWNLFWVKVKIYFAENFFCCVMKIWNSSAKMFWLKIFLLVDNFREAVFSKKPFI